MIVSQISSNNKIINHWGVINYWQITLRSKNFRLLSQQKMDKAEVCSKFFSEYKRPILNIFRNVLRRSASTSCNKQWHKSGRGTFGYTLSPRRVFPRNVKIQIFRSMSPFLAEKLEILDALLTPNYSFFKLH